MFPKLMKTSFWLFPNDSYQKPISSYEKKQADLLPKEKSIQYKISRGNMRYVISKLFKVHPLEVPLFSLPGVAPVLGGNYGYISMSHCNDAILIGWSKNKIGVDIEKSNNPFLDKTIINRFFNEEDKLRIKVSSQVLQKKEMLKIWVIKESLIKWQMGDFFIGLKDWNIDHELKIATNNKTKVKVNINSLRFKSWEIGISSSAKLNSNDIKINLK